jgi:multiple sugar transport system ATP-binding protein
MVFVTHDQVEAMTLGERIAILKDGRLQQYAAPLDIYRRPANLFVATFIGSPPINTSHGALSTEEDRSTFSSTGLKLETEQYRHSGPATLAVRPEALSLNAGTDECFACTVRRLEPLGNEVLVHLNGPGENSWIARVEPDFSVIAGEPVSISVDRSRVHLFAGAEQTLLTAATEQA